jgi:hypothetical protein
MTEITINPVEIATQLAHDDIIFEFENNSWLKDGSRYTDQAQSKFNSYYDYYYEILTNGDKVKANFYL